MAAIGGTNTTTYTTSTKNIFDTSYATDNQQIDTFSTELIGRIQGSSTLFDKTFNVAYTDPSVQAAIVAAEGVLTGAGASSFLGPNLLTSDTSLASSIVSVGSPVGTSTDVSYSTSLYIGPQTIWVSDNQSQQFDIPAGSQDYDTLVTSIIYQTITTTTTDTYLTRDVYELDGVTTTVPTQIPEPATMSLLAVGLLSLGAYRRKITDK